MYMNMQLISRLFVATTSNLHSLFATRFPSNSSVLSRRPFISIKPVQPSNVFSCQIRSRPSTGGWAGHHNCAFINYDSFAIGVLEFVFQFRSHFVFYTNDLKLAGFKLSNRGSSFPSHTGVSSRYIGTTRCKYLANHRVVIILIYGDSFLFVLFTGIVSHGLGVNNSPQICEGAILLCAKPKISCRRESFADVRF
jgi:hypothetical protein